MRQGGCHHMGRRYTRRPAVELMVKDELLAACGAFVILTISFFLLMRFSNILFFEEYCESFIQ